MPRGNLRYIGQRPGQPLGQKPRARRRHAYVDASQQRAFARPRQRAGQFEIGAGRRVNFHHAAIAGAARRGEQRAGGALRHFDIGQRHRAGEQFDAGELAEAVERGNAIPGAEALARAGGARLRLRHRRDGAARAKLVNQRALARHRVGENNLAGRDTRHRR